jgi:hypothetical protein
MIKLILMMALAAASAQAGLSRLEALSMIESGDDDAAVGQVGEVSRYQIQPWIWRQYSSLADYQNRALATQVAEKHLGVLEQLFRGRAKRDLDDFDLYVLWNAGPTYYARIGFSKARVHPIIRNRAQRYANLREATATKPAPPLLAQRTFRPPAPTPSPAPRATPSLPPRPDSLWPQFVGQPPGLQNPMFSILPLTANPIAPQLGQPPLFAIGGVKPE